MPIDPSMLAKSIGTLTDLDPQRDLAATLQQAVIAAKQLFDADAAGVMLADADGQLRWASASDRLAQAIEDNQEIFGQGPCMDAFANARPAAMRDSRSERQWGEITLVLADLQVRSGLSVPVELGGGQGRAQGRAGRPAPGRLGLAGADRAGQGGADGARTPGRPGGVHSPAPGGPVIGT